MQVYLLFSSKMIKKFFCLWTVLTPIVLFAQSKKEVKENKIKSTLESVTIIENGKETTYKDTYTEFDKNGNIIAQTEYNRDGTIKRKVTSKYDSFKNKTEELEYEGNHLVRKRLFSYNGNGEKTLQVTYDGSGKLLKKEVFIYNNKGLRSEKKIYDATNNLIETHKYIYQQ